ncbi:hypothetical protein Bca101_088731 [Brassica carinata]
MHRSGEMPGISAREYPNAFRYFLSSHRRRAVSALFRSAFTITGYVEFGPRNAYLSPLGSVLSSTFGASDSLHGSLFRLSGTSELDESEALFSPRLRYATNLSMVLAESNILAYPSASMFWTFCSASALVKASSSGSSVRISSII